MRRGIDITLPPDPSVMVPNPDAPQGIWDGTVVECTAPASDANGFSLLDVVEITGTTTSTSGTEAHATASDINQVSYFDGGTIATATATADENEFNAGKFQISRSTTSQLAWNRLFGGGAPASPAGHQTNLKSELALEMVQAP